MKGLVNHDKGNTLKIILNTLASKINGEKHQSPNSFNLDYNVYWTVLNSMDYNLPQNRERLFIVGFKDPKINFNFPEKLQRTLNLVDILDQSPEEKNISALSFEYISNHLKNHKLYSEISSLTHLVAYEIRKSRVYFRFDKNSPCLTTKMGTGGNNVPYLVNKRRFFTVRECMNLQGFPKTFKITNNYTNALKQIGNSVSVPVVDSILKNIIRRKN